MSWTADGLDGNGLQLPFFFSIFSLCVLENLLKLCLWFTFCLNFYKMKGLTKLLSFNLG